MNSVKIGGDTLFILLGMIMVLAMHTGLAFLKLGTVRKRNQVNAPAKILIDFAVSIIAYLFIDYLVAYGVNFFIGADMLAQQNGYELVRFFFLLILATATPAVISGDVTECSHLEPQLVTTFALVSFVYPSFGGIAWNERFGAQHWLQSVIGAGFHDLAGSVTARAVGGWIALPAVLLLDTRHGRYKGDGRITAHPPSNTLFLAAGAWMPMVSWFGFNMMSAQMLDRMSGLITINPLMAVMDGAFVTWWMGRNDPGLSYNGPLVGLMAVCTGPDVMHLLRTLATDSIVGMPLIWMFIRVQNTRRIDDVSGVWSLYGLCGAWGGTAAGIFDLEVLGGLGGASFWTRVAGTADGIITALTDGTVVYDALRKFIGLRLDCEAEFMSADLTIHRVSSMPEPGTYW